MSPDLAVTYMPTDSLVPYAGNAKEHPEWQVEQIAASIDQFGFCDPVGVWHDGTGASVIVEGHGRVLAAKMLGIETLPVVTLDHLDDEGRRAYTLAHNQTTMTSGFDAETLAAELGSISDIDMGAFGFDVDSLLHASEGGADPEPVPDVQLASSEVTERLGEIDHVYYAFSGGRDSTLAIMSTYQCFVDEGKQVKAIYVDNGCEMPDLYMHVRRVCDSLGCELVTLRPERTFITEYVAKGKLPNPVFMDCIEKLINHPIDRYVADEIPDTDYVLVRGGRPTQKTTRSKTNLLQTVAGKSHLTIYNPLFEMTADEIEERQALIPHWAGYDRGFVRTACWCCPFQRRPQWEALRECYPLLWDELRRIFETCGYPRIPGDGHPRYVEEYWEQEVGITCQWV